MFDRSHLMAGTDQKFLKLALPYFLSFLNCVAWCFFPFSELPFQSTLFFMYVSQTRFLLLKPRELIQVLQWNAPGAHWENGIQLSGFRG